MPITVQCECGKQYKVGDDKAGKKLRCKACQGVLAVPAGEAAAGADEFDDFGDADFGAGGGFDDFGGDDMGAPEPRSKKSGGGRSGKGSKGKGAKAKGKGGKKGSKGGGKSEMSPVVKYSLAGGIVVVATAAVLGILYSRGVLGGGEKKDAGGGGGAVAGNTEGVIPPGGPGPENPGGGVPNGGNPPANQPAIKLKDSSIVRRMAAAGPENFEIRVMEVNSSGDRGETIATLKGKIQGPENTGTPNQEVKILADGNDPRAAARRAAAANSLAQIGLAMYNYHNVHNVFPLTEEKEKGLSWRVHILPYLEENALYKQFKLDEPWDSEHNKALIAKMPTIYNTAGTMNEGKTSFHVLSGLGTPYGGTKVAYECTIEYEVTNPGALKADGYYFVLGLEGRQYKGRWGDYSHVLSKWQLVKMNAAYWKPRDSLFSQPVGLSNIRDGSSNTIMAVAAGPEAEVEWTKPGGLEFDPKNPIASFGSVSEKGIPVLCFDGSRHTIPPDIDPEAFLHLAQHEDGHQVSIRNVPRKGSTQPGTKTPTTPGTGTPTTPTGPPAVAAVQILAQNPPNNRMNVGKTVRISGEVTKNQQGWVFLKGNTQRYIACKLATVPATLPTVGQTVTIEGKITLNNQQYLTLEPSTLVTTSSPNSPTVPKGNKPPVVEEESLPRK